MRVFKVLFIGIIVSVFLVGQAYSAPNGNANNNANNNNGNNGNNGNNSNNGNNGNNGNANNGNAQAANVNRGNNNAVSQTRGQAAVHKQQARRSSEANRKREERNRSSDRNPSLNNGNSDLAFNNRDSRADNGRRNGEDMGNERANRTIDLLNSLERARWSHNPHDDRGQGNMGKVDMQDPFGHDKDSGREKWEHARPEHVKDKKDDSDEEIDQTGTGETISEEVFEVPIIIEEPTAEELAAVLEEMVSVDWMEDPTLIYYQGMVDYYESVLLRDSLTQSQIDYYNFYISVYEQRIITLQAQTFLRMNLATSNTINYNLNLTTDSESTYLVETSLVLTEDYWDYLYEYNSETGTWDVQVILRKAGETIILQSEEVMVTGEDGTYAFSVDPEKDLLDGYGSGFWSLEVTIVDTTTEVTVTQTMDKTLLVYRDPYGNVEDTVTGEKVVGAKITVFTENGSIVALDKASNPTASNPQVTDATGRFAFNLRTDRKYYMVASAPGYEDYQSEVFTEQWHVIREDIKMMPKQEQMVSNIE